MNSMILSVITSVSLMGGVYSMTAEQTEAVVNESTDVIVDYTIGQLNRVLTVARFHNVPFRSNTAVEAYSQLMQSGLIHDSENRHLVEQLDVSIKFQPGGSWQASRFYLTQHGQGDIVAKIL